MVAQDLLYLRIDLFPTADTPGEASNGIREVVTGIEVRCILYSLVIVETTASTNIRVFSQLFMVVIFLLKQQHQNTGEVG